MALLTVKKKILMLCKSSKQEVGKKPLGCQVVKANLHHYLTSFLKNKTKHFLSIAE